MSRAYLPATLEDLLEWHAAGAVPVGPDALVVDVDDEELEYDALMTAAAVSAELLDGPGRRVVVVADTDPAGPDRVAWTDVVAVHADPADRPLGADPDEDLAWFATQEIPHLFP